MKFRIICANLESSIVELKPGTGNHREKYLRELVNLFTGNTGDDFLKVKRIHDWITENIACDNDIFLERAARRMHCFIIRDVQDFEERSMGKFLHI